MRKHGLCVGRILFYRLSGEGKFWSWNIDYSGLSGNEKTRGTGSPASTDYEFKVNMATVCIIASIEIHMSKKTFDFILYWNEKRNKSWNEPTYQKASYRITDLFH
jgi:hypothetical protein